jgi:hypothetical protein
MPKNKKSVYDVTETMKDDVKHVGYDFKDKIFKNTMSNVLWGEEKREGILAKMEAVLYELIQRVKTIKTHRNYAVGKNYRKFN